MEDMDKFRDIFNDLDDIEASLYYKIIAERIGIIDKLKEVVETDALERVVQEHIYKHLWLLDPSWERATDSSYIEEKVVKAFDAIGEKLTDEERDGRVDIGYKKIIGEHIIVELKRSSVKADKNDLNKQVKKYKNALRKILQETKKENESISVVILLGRLPIGWEEPTTRSQEERSLESEQVKILMYQEMINNSYNSYQAYLEKHRDVGDLQKLLKSIDESLLISKE